MTRDHSELCPIWVTKLVFGSNPPKGTGQPLQEKVLSPLNRAGLMKDLVQQRLEGNWEESLFCFVPQ